MTAFNAAAVVGLVLAKSQFTNYCKVPDGLGGFDLRALAAAGASRLSSPSPLSSFTNICCVNHNFQPPTSLLRRSIHRHRHAEPTGAG